MIVIVIVIVIVDSRDVLMYFIKVSDDDNIYVKHSIICMLPVSIYPTHFSISHSFLDYPFTVLWLLRVL